jgi:nuclear pore complex protein Nup98-Nup96
LAKSPAFGSDEEPRARARAEAEVNAWALLSALFAEDQLGAGRGTAAEVHRRRAGVSAWLREQVARTPIVPERLEGRCAALAHAAGGRSVQAARAAAAHGDPRLATCVAQVGGGKNVAFYAKQQLTRWRAASVGKYISKESEDAFKLLAGEVERDEDGMDWYHNFGLHLWLAAGPTSPLKDVVKSYLKAVADHRAANPSPPTASYDVLEANQATHLRDVSFNILALAASTEEGTSPSVDEVRVAFHPLTYSDDVLNSSFAWHVFTALDAIGVFQSGDKDVDALADEITVAYAVQLLAMPERDHCEWAVFVAQHLRDHVRRVKTTNHILRERIDEWNENEEKIAFMLDSCLVPREMLDEARALWATYTTPKP